MKDVLALSAVTASSRATSLMMLFQKRFEIRKVIFGMQQLSRPSRPDKGPSGPSLFLEILEWQKDHASCSWHNFLQFLGKHSAQCLSSNHGMG